MSDHPHRRFDPLRGRHVLVSPQRASRPWLGAVEPAAAARPPRHDPACSLCPGNARAGGAVNPRYEGVYAFDNDFPALLPDAGPPFPADGLFRAEPVAGRNRVLCFSPDHGATLADLDQARLAAVVDAWADEAATLGRDYPSVQIFENKGAAMGCSNPHPHGQIWATSVLPDEVAAEDANQRAWFEARGTPLLQEVAAHEAALGTRVVEETPLWLAIVPFWAVWPFETLLLPRFPVARLPELAADRRAALAAMLGRLTRRYDALFGTSFPYSMGWHGAPFDGDAAPHWQLHAHFYPPLLRSATVRKFMVGFELLAEAQRDLTPEQAAVRLRAAR